MKTPKPSSSDATQDRTCTTRAVVRSGHRTTASAVKKNWNFFFVPFRPSLTPFLGTPSPGTKLSFCLPKKKIQCGKNRVIDKECLHQVQLRPADLCRPCQRTTIEQYQKWRATISWEVRSRTTVARRRVTKKLACFEDWDTFGDPTTVELTFVLRGVRNRCSCANHIPSTVTAFRRSCGSWRRGTHKPSRKPERWPRDPWKVGHLTMSSSWRISAKRIVCLMIEHSRLSGPQTRWTCNGPELPCRLVFPWAFHPYVVTMVLFTGAPGFRKQVVIFPRSRYDHGLQTSSRILPTWHGQGCRRGLWQGHYGSCQSTWGSFCYAYETSVWGVQDCLHDR